MQAVNTSSRQIDEAQILMGNAKGPIFIIINQTIPHFFSDSVKTKQCQLEATEIAMKVAKTVSQSTLGNLDKTYDALLYYSIGVAVINHAIQNLDDFGKERLGLILKSVPRMGNEDADLGLMSHLLSQFIARKFACEIERRNQAASKL